LRHEIEGRSLGVTVHKEADIKASELVSNTPLRESKNEKGGVELDSIDIREMGANVPAAHELGAKDEILSDKSLRMAEPMSVRTDTNFRREDCSENDSRSLGLTRFNYLLIYLLVELFTSNLQ
jgi:hypothetical protein